MKPKILIVEDEPIIAADLEQEITSMGYEVLEVFESGEETLEYIKNQLPDLVLLDIQLEGHLDGIDTAQEIAKIADIPFIFITSNTDQRSFARAKVTNPFAFLSKPFRATDLKHSIALALDQEKEVANQDEIWYDDRIFIRTKEWMVKIKVEDLLWIEADGCYCNLQTRDKSHTIISTLKKFGEQVPNKELMRVHRSYMVNLDAVDKISDHHVSINNKVIPIGRTYKEAVQKRFRRL